MTLLTPTAESQILLLCSDVDTRWTSLVSARLMRDARVALLDDSRSDLLDALTTALPTSRTSRLSTLNLVRWRSCSRILATRVAINSPSTVIAVCRLRPGGGDPDRTARDTD